jgi:phosphoglycolate phosphatase
MNTNDHIRAVVFDLDGTLFDTLPSLTAAANETLRAAEMRAIPQELLRAALSEGLLPMFRQALALQAAPVEAAAASRLEERFLSCYTRHWLRETSLFTGASSLLAALHARGLPLAICTNRDRATTETLLASGAIHTHFDTIVGIGDAPQPKPAADPLLRVLEILALQPSEILFVGDSYMDARCAALSQVRFAAHLGGYAARQEDLLPNVVQFEHYAQLTPWVLDRAPKAKEICHG